MRSLLQQSAAADVGAPTMHLTVYKQWTYDEKQRNYIVYLPSSSGLISSSHFLSFSWSVALVARSTAWAWSSTPCRTKIGAFVRSASAMASLGRASTTSSLPPCSRWRAAKKVFSFRSEITTLTTVPPSRSTSERRRSWVMGRGGSIPSIREAMACASEIPIQMGRKSWFSTSLRITMGTFDEGSSIRPLISTRSSTEGSLMKLLWDPAGNRSRTITVPFGFYVFFEWPSSLSPLSHPARERGSPHPSTFPSIPL